MKSRAPLNRSVHGDTHAALGLHRPLGQRDLQQTVVVLHGYAFGIDIRRQLDHALKGAVLDLDRVVDAAGVVAAAVTLLAAHGHTPTVELDLDLLIAHPRDFHQHNDL